MKDAIISLETGLFGLIKACYGLIKSCTAFSVRVQSVKRSNRDLLNVSASRVDRLRRSRFFWGLEMHVVTHLSLKMLCFVLGCGRVKASFRLAIILVFV